MPHYFNEAILKKPLVRKQQLFKIYKRIFSYNRFSAWDFLYLGCALRLAGFSQKQTRQNF